MLRMLTAVAEIAPSGWDDFVVRNSETPYPQTTLNARYTTACYGLTPIYCSAELADSRLQCLVFVNQARKILKWSCGPVLTGDSAQFGELTGLFIDWVSRQKCRIRTSTSVEICTLKSLLAANELLSHARQARMEDRLGALVKKDLTGDIWESAVYRSAGKKRKTKGLVDKS